jgi:hypothetical protein
MPTEPCCLRRPVAPADLRSPAKGGKTAFPEADLTKQAMGGEHRPGASADEWYCSDDRVLAASPNPGTGVLFWWGQSLGWVAFSGS